MKYRVKKHLIYTWIRWQLLISYSFYFELIFVPDKNKIEIIKELPDSPESPGLPESLADCPAMSFVFVCWHKYQKYKSVELGDQLPIP